MVLHEGSTYIQDVSSQGQLHYINMHAVGLGNVFLHVLQDTASGKDFSAPSGRTDIPRAPPNDRERHGNIWQRYEELESATQRLDTSNKQLAAERSRNALV